MMETFLVLGLCFILYEALDFFQGCIHSNTPSPSDQIEAYRRELNEQRQQQQQEQLIASFTPLLGAQFAAAAAAAAGSQSSLDTTTPTATATASTASVISDSYEQSQQQPHSLSTPGLFRPSLGGYPGGYYDPEDPLHATSSLPRDYYYLQQQQLKNKVSAKSLLSKFSSTNSDNRVHPEATSHGVGVLGVNASAVITTQPLPAGEASSLFDCQPSLPPLLPASPLLVELKRAILSSGQTQKQSQTQHRSSSSSGCDVEADLELDLDEEEEEEEAEEDEELLSDDNICVQCEAEAELSNDSGSPAAVVTATNSVPNICAASHAHRHAQLNQLAQRIHHIAIDDIGIGHPHQHQSSGSGGRDAAVAASLTANSHADFREIECERLRRKCVSVKRIYSISEKF